MGFRKRAEFELRHYQEIRVEMYGKQAEHEPVRAKRGLLPLAFGLDPSDPNSMPVTRDLSRSKRLAILRWLDDDPPLSGSPPADAATVAAAPPAATSEAISELPPESSKAHAAARRRGVTGRR